MELHKEWKVKEQTQKSRGGKTTPIFSCSITSTGKNPHQHTVFAFPLPTTKPHGRNLSRPIHPSVRTYKSLREQRAGKTTANFSFNSRGRKCTIIDFFVSTTVQRGKAWSGARSPPTNPTNTRTNRRKDLCDLYLTERAGQKWSSQLRFMN